MKFIGYEVNESLSTTQEQFRLKEEVVFMQVAEDVLFYDIKLSRQTIWIHREYTSTTCPHQSWDIHVGGENNENNRNTFKDFFIGRIQFWMDVLKGKKDIPTKKILPEKYGAISEQAPEGTTTANPKEYQSEVQSHTLHRGFHGVSTKLEMQFTIAENFR